MLHARSIRECSSAKCYGGGWCRVTLAHASARSLTLLLQQPRRHGALFIEGINHTTVHRNLSLAATTVQTGSVTKNAGNE